MADKELPDYIAQAKAQLQRAEAEGQSVVRHAQIVERIEEDFIEGLSAILEILPTLEADLSVLRDVNRDYLVEVEALHEAASRAADDVAGVGNSGSLRTQAQQSVANAGSSS